MKWDDTKKIIKPGWLEVEWFQMILLDMQMFLFHNFFALVAQNTKILDLKPEKNSWNLGLELETGGHQRCQGIGKKKKIQRETLCLLCSRAHLVLLVEVETLDWVYSTFNIKLFL